MKKILIPVYCFFVLTLCSCALFGPPPDQSKFYILYPVKHDDLAKPSKKICVNLLPVAAPPYMVGRQIVSLESRGILNISEFHRWGESPTDGISRVIAENLSRINPDIEVFDYPAVSFSENAISLRVIVNECIGVLGDKLVLTATWQISSSPSNYNDSGKFRLELPIKGSDYSAYVSTMSDALGELSGELNKAIIRAEKSNGNP